MSVTQLRVKGLLLLCGLFVLLGTFLLLRQTTDQGVVPAYIAPNAKVVLDDERQNLAAGTWRAVSVNVPFSGLLEVSLRVVKGNPIDVIFIDGSKLNYLQSGHWGKTKGNPAFEATRVEEYERLSEVAEGSYYLVYRDSFLGILSTNATDVAVRISLSPLLDNRPANHGNHSHQKWPKELVSDLWE
jgi:hypothetical protein